MKPKTATSQTQVAALMPELRGHSLEQASISLTTILPEQFYTPAKDSHERWTGERSLMFAVLQEAVQSYLKYGHSTTQRGRRLFAETKAWFQNTDVDYVFSFESICVHLQLDPAYLRRGLEALILRSHSHPPLSRTTYRRTAVEKQRNRVSQVA